MNKTKRRPESSMAGRVLGQCFLKNHQNDYYRAMIGLLLLVITVLTLAVQSALAAANPLTNEEQTWLKAHPNTELGDLGAFEPAVIVNEEWATNKDALSYFHSDSFLVLRDAINVLARSLKMTIGIKSQAASLDLHNLEFR